MLTCHFTVGVGLPEAAAVKLAVAPVDTVVFVGFNVTAGGVVAGMGAAKADAPTSIAAATTSATTTPRIPFEPAKRLFFMVFPFNCVTNCRTSIESETQCDTSQISLFHSRSSN